jgi:hypothetical protein
MSVPNGGLSVARANSEFEDLLLADSVILLESICQPSSYAALCVFWPHAEKVPDKPQDS